MPEVVAQSKCCSPDLVGSQGLPNSRNSGREVLCRLDHHTVGPWASLQLGVIERSILEKCVKACGPDLEAPRTEGASSGGSLSVFPGAPQP